jgi:carboxylate-amine ligase
VTSGAGDTSLWERWPTAGPPPFFESIDEYDDTVRMLIDTGTVLDGAMIYWDVRASAKWPTIEMRVSNAASTVAEAVLIATALCTNPGPDESAGRPPTPSAQHLARIFRENLCDPCTEPGFRITELRSATQ